MNKTAVILNVNETGFACSLLSLSLIKLLVILCASLSLFLNNVCNQKLSAKPKTLINALRPSKCLKVNMCKKMYSINFFINNVGETFDS